MSGDSQKLLELAERCEKAEGPDRELDAAIWQAVHGNEMYWSLHERGGNVCLRYYPGPPGPEYHALKRYTASLDAALTLVPEGLHWQVNTIRGETDSATIYHAAVYAQSSWLHSRGATPALALVPSALRARAAI